MAACVDVFIHRGPYGANSVQILTVPDTESPKKAWFAQSGLCDLAAVKGLFKSSALVLYTNLSGFRAVWKEDNGGGQVLSGKEVERSWERILEEEKGLFGLYILILVPP